jgi:hypothetical protein
MAAVSGDFAGDSANLATAIRNDFRAFNNIMLGYTLNTITTDAKGIVYVSLTYSRTVTSRKTSSTLSDRGSTEFGFKLEDNGLKLYLMRIPLLFGLSDASNVATGVVNTGANTPTLVVDKQGNASTPPLPQAITDQQNGGGNTAQSGTESLSYAANSSLQSYTFATSSLQTTVSYAMVGDLGFFCYGGPNTPYMMLRTGTKTLDLGSESINSVTSVPNQSTYSGTTEIPLVIGEVYALYLPTNKYALIRIGNSSMTHATCSPQSASSTQFDFRYQTDGTTNVSAQ